MGRGALMMKIILAFAVLIGLAVASYYFNSRTTDAMAALELTGPDQGNSNDQLLACTAAQSIVKERFHGTVIFPFCSGVPVKGFGPRFVVSSFFELADSSGIKRRQNFTVTVEKQPGGFLTSIPKWD
jgi:hypothetical protein